jgi:hypothetical protein
MIFTRRWIISAATFFPFPVSIMIFIASIASIAFITFITGCGEEGKNGDKAKVVTQESSTLEAFIPNYFSLAAGNSWEYQLAPSGNTVVRKITGQTKLIGHQYFILTTSSPDELFEELLRATAGGIRRYVKDINTDVIRNLKSYMTQLFPGAEVKVITPPLEVLYMPYPLEINQKWTIASIETFVKHQREELKLTSAISGQVVNKESVTVPAGSFEAFKLEISISSEVRINGDVEKFPPEVIDRLWFAENVGLIQVTFGDQMAQLVKYHIAK